MAEAGFCLAGVAVSLADAFLKHDASDTVTLFNGFLPKMKLCELNECGEINHSLGKYMCKLLFWQDAGNSLIVEII